MLKQSVQSLILAHLQGKTEESESLTNWLTRMFPKYIYFGLAYRANIHTVLYDSSKNLKVGASYTVSKDSINQFLADNNFGAQPDDKAVIIKAEIEGFNLGHFIKENIEEFSNDIQEEIISYSKESEILLLKLSKVIQEFDA